MRTKMLSSRPRPCVDAVSMLLLVATGAGGTPLLGGTVAVGVRFARIVLSAPVTAVPFAFASPPVPAAVPAADAVVAAVVLVLLPRPPGADGVTGGVVKRSSPALACAALRSNSSRRHDPCVNRYCASCDSLYSAVLFVGAGATSSHCALFALASASFSCAVWPSALLVVGVVSSAGITSPRAAVVGDGSGDPVLPTWPLVGGDGSATASSAASASMLFSSCEITCVNVRPKTLSDKRERQRLH